MLPPKGRLYGAFPFWHALDNLEERNISCFEGNVSYQEEIILKMKFCIAYWVSIFPDFWGLSLDAIMFDWREVITL